MALPDASRLLALPPAKWRALGERLVAVGMTNETLLDVTRSLDALTFEVRRVLRRGALRRRKEPACWAFRMLSYGDAVREEEARSVLGELLTPLVDVGFLTLEGARCVSPFFLRLHDADYMLVDDLAHGDAAVMGSGSTTEHLSRAAVPTERVKRALDFGCGSGPTALTLARRAEQVVGIDVNPRAIDFAKVSAAINGIDNVDFRVGDMFAPIEGERFDVISSQPPFVPRAAGSKESTFLHGGARGDEFPLRVLAEAPRHLEPGGRCVLYVDWPEIEGDPLEARLRAAQPSTDFDLLVLAAPSVAVDGFAATYAAHEQPILDVRYADAVTELCTHLARVAITSFRPTFTVIRKRASQATDAVAFTRVVPVRSMNDVVPTSRRIDRFFAARDLFSASDATLLDAQLRVPKGTLFDEVRDEPDPNSDAVMTVRFAARAMLGPMGCNREAFVLVSLMHRSESVRAAAELLAEDWHAPLEGVLARILPATRQAIDAGILVVS